MLSRTECGKAVTIGSSAHRAVRKESFGERGLSWVDRFGVYLSKRAILRHLRSNQDLVALDLGCGYEATILRALSAHLVSGVGVDIKISQGARRTPRLSFVEAPIEDALAGMESERFNLVLLISVLEHLARPVPVLEECHRVMCRGALLMINVPTWRGKFFLELSAFRLGTSPACEMDDHKMYYDVRDLWPLLVQTGFAPSQIRMNYHKFGLNLFAVARKTA
jgi:SAM-dependent methyltransferase